MIAILGNSAVFEHDNTIRHAHGGESVRNKKSSFGGRKIGKSLEDFVFAARIQRSSGFVRDEDLRVAEIRARQRNFLPLTSCEVYSLFNPPPYNWLISVGKPSAHCFPRAFLSLNS